MKYWTAEAIKYRLFYWWNFHNFTMGSEADPIPKVDKKTRRSSDAYFVPSALENAFFDEAFGTLTDREQQILIRLYMDDGRDESHYQKGMVCSACGSPDLNLAVSMKDSLVLCNSCGRLIAPEEKDIGEWQVRIIYTNEAIEDLSLKMGISERDIYKIQFGAIGKMLEYLNPKGKLHGNG
jgi:hypothetical protein